MIDPITLIGYGEAGSAFARASGWGARTRAYDVRPVDYAGAVRAEDLASALAGSAQILSLVAADQALVAAEHAAHHIATGALYFDMNSVAPDTKRAAAAAIEASGGRYVDVAVMAPVHPQRMAVPLLLSGPHAEAGEAALAALGFADIRVVGGEVGRASSIKMIRSIMVKGIEALTGEMMAGARAAGVEDEVLASLGEGWAAKAAYNLERMATHGNRRAAEMEESAKTLSALGVDPVMTRGTIIRQREAAL